MPSRNFTTYEHDCDACVFVGQYTLVAREDQLEDVLPWQAPQPKVVDIYRCAEHGEWVVRHSSEPSDYRSTSDRSLDQLLRLDFFR